MSHMHVVLPVCPFLEQSLLLRNIINVLSHRYSKQSPWIAQESRIHLNDDNRNHSPFANRQEQEQEQEPGQVRNGTVETRGFER